MHDLLAITFNKPSGSNEARNMLSVIRHLGCFFVEGSLVIDVNAARINKGSASESFFGVVGG